MERRKLTSEDIDKVRDIEGFPIATDEAIIELSDAPYYTACPNPFIKDFIDEYGTPYDEATDDYHCEPYSADVTAGKNNPIYRAHSYHTKVPHKAVMQYINHYTRPGDVVLDAFCGTGMVGVAARALADDTDEYVALNKRRNPGNYGSRNALLCDLSPAATCIASQYDIADDAELTYADAEKAIQECKAEYGWMFRTKHTAIGNSSQTRLDVEACEYGWINYTVYSDVLICPSCGQEFIFYDTAVDQDKGKVLDTFA